MLFHFLQQLFNRRFGNHSIELGPVVVDDTHVLDHHVIHFPLPVDRVQAVVNGGFTAAAADHLPFDVALDSVVYAKVLPKIRCEDAPRYRSALQACEGALAQFKLARSAAKLGELRRDLETTGSARFWR